MSPDCVQSALSIGLEPISSALSVARDEEGMLGDVFPDESCDEPAVAASRNVLRRRIAQLMGTLTQRERQILQLRYGLQDGREHTLEEMARMFHVTRERVRQLVRRALDKLQHPRRRSELVGFLDAHELTITSHLPAPGSQSDRQAQEPPSARTGDTKAFVKRLTSRDRCHHRGQSKSSRARHNAPSPAALRAIQEGVRRGDGVARLEHLGLPQRTISMLEESKFSIITLRDLVNVRRTDLQQIRHLGEGAIDRILDCLTRYDQLESQPPQN